MSASKNTPEPQLQEIVQQFAHISLRYAKARWSQGLALGVLGVFLWKADFDYALLPTNSDHQSAALAMPRLDGEVIQVRYVEERGATVKRKGHEAKVRGGGDLNLANEATATSNALTAAQREAAAHVSHLTFALDPDFAKRRNIDPAVVREKMRFCSEYIKAYIGVARDEARKHNIPVSITLAQGLLESNAGSSRLATKANNHFGIKCFSRTCRKGHCMNATDDSHKDFFVVFGSGEESFRARSKFLCKDRYKHLLRLKRSEYKKWAHGLKKAGYATDPNYAQKLIAIIENLKLYVYDHD